MLKRLLVAGAAVAALGAAVAAPAHAAADPRKDGYGHHKGYGHDKGGHSKDYDGDYDVFEFFKDNDFYKHEYNYERDENKAKINQILPVQICQLANVLAVAKGDCVNGPDIDNVEIDRD